MEKPIEKQAWKNYKLPITDRVKDLISRLTLDEKVSQMVYTSPAIPRLGIPEHNWWNEGLHGVGRAGIATVFPQAIGMSSSFNVDLMHKVADVTSTEARAKHHEYARQGDREIYKGLTFWSPNVNIFRDPRWGRGQETYGEDPFLTGRMGVAFIKGLQGDDPKYLKLAATPKHFAVHSGPEVSRHHFDARVSAKDLRETYLPAFKACVQEGKAASVMGAYNRTNGEACCASETLLKKILRQEWGFEGYIVSDCGAIHDIHQHHKITNSPEESAALAVKNGCDLNCGKVYDSLVLAVKKGLIEEEIIDIAVSRLMHVRMQLGMFDPPEQVPYAHEHASAILQAWYPGEEGGTAVAEVVFGDYNPAGRLPVTFVKSLDQLPPFSDYCMEGRTYRHLKEEPLYPFGYGLSYTKFRYSNLILDKHRVVSGESVQVSIQIENTGSRVGDEVVQLYLEALGSLIPVPRWELQGFSRIHLQPGEKKKVKFLLGTRQMALIDSDGLCVLEPGDFRIHVGGRQPDERSAKLTKSEICSADFELLGPREKIPY